MDIYDSSIGCDERGKGRSFTRCNLASTDGINDQSQCVNWPAPGLDDTRLS
jgi:hypothetical protein